LFSYRKKNNIQHEGGKIKRKKPGQETKPGKADKNKSAKKKAESNARQDGPKARGFVFFWGCKKNLLTKKGGCGVKYSARERRKEESTTKHTALRVKRLGPKGQFTTKKKEKKIKKECELRSKSVEEKRHKIWGDKTHQLKRGREKIWRTGLAKGREKTKGKGVRRGQGNKRTRKGLKNEKTNSVRSEIGKEEPENGTADIKGEGTPNLGRRTL